MLDDAEQLFFQHYGERSGNLSVNYVAEKSGRALVVLNAEVENDVKWTTIKKNNIEVEYLWNRMLMSYTVEKMAIIEISVGDTINFWGYRAGGLDMDIGVWLLSST